MANWKRTFKFTYKDISKLTGISPGALRQRLTRGLDLHDLKTFSQFVLDNEKEEEVEDEK